MAKIIELSGIDGVGKTTAFNHICNSLEKNNLKVLRTREVGSPHIKVCQQLREIVLNPELELDGKSMEFIFAAMRIENQKFYNSIKDKYDYIVSDRGYLDHLAYTDHNVSTEFTKEFYKNIVAKYTTTPDNVIYLDLDPEIGNKRRIERGDKADSIEKKGLDFQSKVRDSFIDHLVEGAAKQHFQFYMVDASRTKEEVQKQLDKVLERIIGDK